MYKTSNDICNFTINKIVNDFKRVLGATLTKTDFFISLSH